MAEVDGLSGARIDSRVSGSVEARFNAAMDTVLNEAAGRTTHAADISAEANTQVADTLVRNNTEIRNINSDSCKDPNQVRWLILTIDCS